MKTVVVRKLRFVPILLLLANANCSDGKTGPSGATTLDANSATTVSQVAGTAVSPAPSVIVRDESGSPLAGATVTFNVVSGGGSVTGPSTLTDVSGIAAVGGWTLGKTAGPNVLNATYGELSVSFNATGVAGPTALLTVSAGDAQSGVAGAALPVAPAVLVQDGNGNPKVGASVSFAVASGGGSVTGATAISNGAGIATAGSWTLGPTPAANTLVATSPGAPSVTFQAVGSTAKCAERTAYAIGSTANGTLETNDCQFSDGSFVDFFSTAVPQANAYLFKQAGTFDTYLDLSFTDGTVIAENDDATDTDSNSAIKALLPAGSYLVGASSFDAGTTGSYNISSQVTSADNANCEIVFVVKNVTTTQNIATDCLANESSAASPLYADAFYILLRAGQSITINMSSTAVDSYLGLVRISGTAVAQNDNRNSSTKDAQITFTASVTDYYAIVARTAVASQTGAYTLTIQ